MEDKHVFIPENILTADILNNLPEETQQKLKNWQKVLCDECIQQHNERQTEMQSQIADLELKLQQSVESVDELRTQLDTVSNERIQLLETVNKYEHELGALRSERNAVTDERDTLLRKVERQKLELDRVQVELSSAETQLKNAISGKCEAIAILGDIESKEASVRMKEQRFEQERAMFNSQIQALSDDLNRTTNELQSTRSHSRMEMMNIHTKLKNTTKEVRILERQCNQIQEENNELKDKLQRDADESRKKFDEYQKYMDRLSNELNAKTKLAELYKGEAIDKEQKTMEIIEAINDHKRMLREAENLHGEMETKMKAMTVKHEQDLLEKDKEIDALKCELKSCKELIKTAQMDSVDNDISQIAPSAAVASRLMRADLSMTELYSMYVKATEDLEIQKRENSLLSLQIKTILSELEEKAPQIQNICLKYEKIVEINKIIAHHRDELLAKCNEQVKEIANAYAKISQLRRLMQQDRQLQTDKNRQICYLLHEIKRLRVGDIGDDMKNDHSSVESVSTDPNEIISEHLVTFKNITDIQELNQKLIMCVRDLSNKVEEVQQRESQDNQYKEKLESSVKKLHDLQETLNRQNTTITTLLLKSERYKKLYFKTKQQLNKTIAANDSSMDVGREENDSGIEYEKRSRKSPNGGKIENPKTDKRMRELERDVSEAKRKYNALKEQYEFYTKEKHNNEKLMNEQLDSLQSELRELTSANCRLSASLDYTKEQLKLQQKNIATYKNQIAALEDRNRSYENTIVKHEQSIYYLKDEIMKTQRAHAVSESEANHLRQENRILNDAAAGLQIERDVLYQQSQNQNLLLTYLEFIKNNLERSVSEGRLRLETRLDEAMREMGAQRLRFQEEEQRFRDLTQTLQQETDNAKRLAKEEEEVASKLRNVIIVLREELAEKALQYDEISKKLQETLTPSKDDNPFLDRNETKIYIDSLLKERDDARTHSENYFKMVQNAEKEIRNLYESHAAEKTKLEGELSKLKQSNLDMESKISELEAEVQLVNIPENNVTDTNVSIQLEKSQNDVKNALQKLADSERNLRNLRAENSSLAESLSAAEIKYANELSLHSDDIQELTKIKTESIKIHDELLKLQNERDAAKDAYQQLKDNQDEILKLVENEKKDLENRIADLNTLNSNLHDQIEALTTKLSTLTQPQTNTSLGSISLSFLSVNESAMMDTSTTDTIDNSHNYQQLLDIIKFLRKEKDITNAQLDILSAEKSRLLSEQKMLQKKVDELEGLLKAERTKSNDDDEVMSKIETLDALTDSNRSLREERNAMTENVKKMNERIKALEDELAPLNEKVSELTAKLNETTSENLSLRTEAIKWRQGANVLVQKSNKNPEEFKRLQLERENLAKMLTTEKDNTKKLNDELTSLRAEKSRLEQEIQTLQRQLQQSNDEKKKANDDFLSQKQLNARIMAEVMDVKNKLLQKEETCQKLTEELDHKEAQLLDIKNKEMKIRKIAKRYKDAFIELKAQTTGTEINAANAASTSQDQMDIEGASASVPNVVSLATQVAENSKLRVEMECLNKTITNLQEENERMRKNSDLYKASLKNVERSDVALRDAQARILSITELKNAAEHELAEVKVKLQHAQTIENNEAVIRQYEETIERMQRELIDQSNANKEERTRLARENEQLLMRIGQLNRQLGGLQQSAKPSTSSVATDKSCISESSSPRTENVKPMSGSSTAQQSATVTPWRGGETLLASIRPFSVQNSRTAAVLPTSQQTASAGSSTSTSSTSSSTSSSTGAGAPSSAGSSNTALVPPQQVHTTGNSSIECMSSLPTSSHTDYMPSTSTSASVAVAAIPPMGSAFASAAESSQEAESCVQQREPHQNESQLIISGGQQQVAALVSLLVEGSMQNASESPNLQLQQDPNAIQLPSTSGTTSSSTSHIAAVSSHSRHTPSSSNVTTTQASTSVSHKRPRDHDGDSSTSAEEGGSDKSPSKIPKRMRTPMHSAGPDAVASILIGVTDADVEYQVPTSSQRDQEDEVHSLGDDDEDEEDDGMAEADDGPAKGEHDGYEDYEQDQDMDDAEVNESNIRCSVDAGDVDDDDEEDDSNEVEIIESQPSISGSGDNQTDPTTGASTSQSQEQDQQQSRAISSGSSDTPNIPQTIGVAPWKQASSSQDDVIAIDNIPGSGGNNEPEDYSQNKRDDSVATTGGVVDNGVKSASDSAIAAGGPVVDANEKNAESAFDEVGNAAVEASENIDSESHQSSSATQSEIQDVQQSEENIDGVSSEGEKPAVEEIEEEGREAEASTSHSVNTRSRGSPANRSGNSQRRPTRTYQRGGGNRTPIVGLITRTYFTRSRGSLAITSTYYTRSRGSLANRSGISQQRPNRTYQRVGGNRTPIVWGNEGPCEQMLQQQQQQQQQQHQSVAPMRGVYLPQRAQRGRPRSRGRGNLLTRDIPN